MRIHLIGTVNGQVNEGMRNVATHIGRALEKEHEVHYSGLKDIAGIVKWSRACDATIVFARANKLVYWLTRIVTMFSKNTWIVCVQKPDADFTTLVKNHPLKSGYFTIVMKDLEQIICHTGYEKKLIHVGIKADKFKPVSAEKQKELKIKYGFDPEKKMIIHVGHCSAGRGLEDFAAICNPMVERMVVASGMFENADTVTCLEKSGVIIHKGYLEHVEEIYQMADVYLFPTHSTEHVISIPLSVMEALSCGTPVIGYKDFENLAEIESVPGAVTLIQDKESLDKTISVVTKKKGTCSFLINCGTWEDAAVEMLNEVRRKAK